LVAINFSDRDLQIKMFADILVICSKFDAVLVECLPVIKPIKIKGGSALRAIIFESGMLAGG
jgi:hypothetical protein